MKGKVPVSINKIYEVKITGLGQSGEGVGRYENFTIFVPNALPNEIVNVQIDLVKKNYATGSIKSFVKKSSQRVEPICPIYEKCGACQLQHYEYTAQLEAKKQKVLDMMEHIALKKGAKILDTLEAQEPFYYRNKMQFPLGKTKKGIIVGCYQRGSHHIIDTKHCYIQKDTNNKIASVVRDMAEKFKLSIYDEKNHFGLFRHVVGRVNRDETEAMVILVITQMKIPKEKEIIKYLVDNIPNLKTVVLNINRGKNNIIMGETNRIIYGKGYITDRLGDLHFKISPLSFFQVNTQQAEKLYETALDFANLTGKEIVIDGYCGTGTISLFLAQKAKKVYGIEIVKDAISDAIKNARDNKIKNSEFLVGDAQKIMPRLYKMGIRADVIVTDPPRAGSSIEVLKTYAAMKPKRIVYVSCNPATLARDVKILDELGYKLIKIKPVDMFPQTGHVECVALIERR